MNCTILKEIKDYITKLHDYEYNNDINEAFTYLFRHTDKNKKR